MASGNRFEPCGIYADMAGTLHLFRRNLSGDSPVYQVNITEVSNTFVKVFEEKDDIEEFLVAVAGLDDAVAESVLHDLRSTGNVVLEGVPLKGNTAMAAGMIAAKSEF